MGAQQIEAPKNPDLNLAEADYLKKYNIPPEESMQTSE